MSEVTKYSPAIEAWVAEMSPGETVLWDNLAAIEAHDEVGRLVQAAARSRQPRIALGRWELSIGNPEGAGNSLSRCGGDEVLGRHEHFIGLGAEPGVHEAVAAWSGEEPETVYILDQEYRSVEPAGTVAAWLVHLALSEGEPAATAPDEPREISAFGRRVNPITVTPTANLPADPKAWEPEPAIAAKLKGGDHLGFAELKGVPVAVHKKGIRAWIGGKKKAKGVVKSAASNWDAAGDLVWLRTWTGLGCVRVPELEVAVRDNVVSPFGQLIALGNDCVLVEQDQQYLQVFRLNGDHLQATARQHAGFKKHLFTVGCRSRYAVCSDYNVGRAVIYRWDGDRLRMMGGYSGQAGQLWHRPDGTLVAIAHGHGLEIHGLDEP